jgi:hypothetical protein
MKRRNSILMVLAVILILAVSLTCCSKKEAAMEGYLGGETSDKSLVGEPAMMEAPSPKLAPPAPAPPASTDDITTAPTTIPEPTTKKRKIIKTADITIEVKDFADSLTKVREIMKEVAPSEQDGFIADSSSSKSETGAMSGMVIIRVSPAKFDVLVDKLMAVGDVQYQRIAGQDVTKEYYDLQARLTSKQEMEKRLIQLLATKTNSVADLLEVERELGRVREEIESIQGTLRYYDDLVGMSTVNLTIQEPESVVSGAGGFWGPIKQAVTRSFEVFGKSIAALIIFFMGVLPWAIVGYVVFLIVRKIVRKRRARAQQTVSAKTKTK